MPNWWQLALIIAGSWIVASLIFAGIWALVGRALNRQRGPA